MKIRKVVDVLMAMLLVFGVCVTGLFRVFHSDAWRVLFALLMGSFIALGMYIFYSFLLLNWFFK